MQDFDEPRPSKSTSNAPILMLLIAAGMIGSSFGIMVADRDALPYLRGKITWLASGNAGNWLAGAKSETPSSNDSPAPKQTKKLSSRVIPTGLSSIDTIRYTARPDSTTLAFDLKTAALVATGELRNPDRIYIDLQDNQQDGTTSDRLAIQKTFKFGGDLVSRARIALKESGAVRIVLDLNRSCEFSYEAPPDGTPRLIVKLRPRAARASAPKPIQPEASDSKPGWVVAQYPTE